MSSFRQDIATVGSWLAGAVATLIGIAAGVGYLFGGWYCCSRARCYAGFALGLAALVAFHVLTGLAIRAACRAAGTSDSRCDLCCGDASKDFSHINGCPMACYLALQIFMIPLGLIALCMPP